MKNLVFGLAIFLLLGGQARSASYFLQLPEKTQDGAFPALVEMGKKTVKGVAVSADGVLKLYSHSGKIDRAMVQIGDRVLVFKSDVISTDKLLGTAPVKLKPQMYKPLVELFPSAPDSGLKKAARYLLPYGIRIAPAALMFGAPISVALVGQGVITDLIIKKQEKGMVSALNARISEQELRINNLESKLNNLNKLIGENNEEVSK
jgi:hypothetical protein